LSLLKHNLLVLGSQNFKKQDQKLTRDQIRPVQIIFKDGTVRDIDFFNFWGRVGVSSIAWDKRFPDELFVSENEEIRRLNIVSKSYQILQLGRIGDIHDIHFLNDILWISNTEYDEAIGYDPLKNKVVQRISLTPFRKIIENKDEGFEKVIDRFHCNQVFLNFKNERCVLIHHITGWQFYRILFEALVKQQGDGGILNLETEEIFPLKLQSPHSVRLINDEYWIQDSGDKSIKIFDQEWKLKSTIELGGFGRGVAFSEDENIGYIGLSATRKRYLKVIPTGNYLKNRIKIVDLMQKETLGELVLSNIEQVDNVYILDDRMLSVFQKLI
tara:strand:- start:115 stop:1098 length:984 start_codon:yes stop_codon:yes gene_type:complete